MKRAIPRGLSSSILAAGAASVLCACGPETFANISLRVREPVGAERIRKELVSILYQLDDDEELSLSFQPGETRVQFGPIPLGREEHTLIAGVALGANPRDPDVVGRGNAVRLPSIDEHKEDGGQGDFTAEVPLLLGTPNLAEPLSLDTPLARAGTVVCDEPGGEGWIFGGVDGGGVDVQNAYRFSLKTLDGTVALQAPELAGHLLACDGVATENVVVFDATAGEVHFQFPKTTKPFDRGPSPRDSTFAFVGVGPELVWVADDNAIQVFDRDGRSIARFANSPFFHAFVSLGDDRLVGVDAVGSLRTIRLDNTTIVVSDPGQNPLRPDVVAVDPNSPHLVEKIHEPVGNQDIYFLVELTADDSGVVSARRVRELDIGGAKPSELFVLRDGRAVILDRDNGAKIVVEGNDAVPVAREHLMKTMGDTLVVFGGTDGHDMFVPPEPPEANDAAAGE
jgi:hypothetical protein